MVSYKTRKIGQKSARRDKKIFLILKLDNKMSNAEGLDRHLERKNCVLREEKGTPKLSKK